MPQSRIRCLMRQLQPADHLCWLYDDEAELQAVLELGAQVAARAGVPFRAWPGPSVQTLPQEIGEAGGAWLAADLSWAACEEAGFDAHLRRAWQAAEAHGVRLVELYDARRLPAARLLALLRGHNQIVLRGETNGLQGAAVADAPADGTVGAPASSPQAFCWLRDDLDRHSEELAAFQAIARAVRLSLPLDEILQAALAQIVTLVQADLGYISLRERPSGRLLSYAVQGAPPSLVRFEADSSAVERLVDRAMLAGTELVVVGDIRQSPYLSLVPAAVLQEGYVSFLFALLRSGGEVQGAIILASRTPEHLGRKDGELLSSLCEQVGVALDNARLYAEAQGRAEEMSSLYELSLAAASLDPGDILRLIGEQIVRQFDAPCFFVALVDKEADAMDFAYILDRGELLEPFTAPMGQNGGLTAHVLRTGRPLLISDLAAEADQLPVPPIHFGEAARSWLGVPLVAKGRTIGMMSVQSYAPSAFDENDLHVLSLAAQQAASALENARLFQETRTLEQRYHKLLEDLNDGYAVLQDGRVVFANARLSHMLGASPDALLASSLEELFTQQDRAKGLLDVPSERLGARPVHYRLNLQKSDRSELPVEVTLSAIDYEGRPALAILCRDISSQVRLENQLLQAEKLSAVGQLVSGVAHELNNPLTTIKGYAQLLQAEGLHPAAVEDLKRIEDAADRCRRIVRDLLTFARHYEPERSDTDLNELLRRTVALRSYEMRLSDITVHWDLDPSLPLIQGDPHRLQQVILNLVFNAEQALASAGEGGRMWISSQVSPDGKHIRFEIGDNGPGIRPEHMDRIFDPFFTTKEVGMGTGLGLSISYGIVQEHGGRIWVQSRHGAGATFFVELPIEGPPVAAPNSDPQT